MVYFEVFAGGFKPPPVLSTVSGTWCTYMCKCYQSWSGNVLLSAGVTQWMCGLCTGWMFVATVSLEYVALCLSKLLFSFIIVFLDYVYSDIIPCSWMRWVKFVLPWDPILWGEGLVLLKQTLCSLRWEFVWMLSDPSNVYYNCYNIINVNIYI